MLKSRVLSYDMMAPFIIPDFIDEYSLEVEDQRGYFYATGVNLFKQWYKISLQQEILFQRYSYYHCVEDEDISSCEWTLELFVNSCNSALIKRIVEKYETLDELEQGVIMYMNISFDDIFNMRKIFITYLNDFVKNFS